MKNKILNYIFEKNRDFFVKKCEIKPDLEKLYEENNEYFDLLSLKSFVGYIPTSIKEPTLKIFEEGGEAIERWTLWQSWYINRKEIDEIKDPLKIMFYNGMKVYLKIINTMARVHKKTKTDSISSPVSASVDNTWIDSALEGVEAFKKNIKNDSGN
jgi:hypothetical protein